MPKKTILQERLNGFVGVKPSLEEVSKVLENWGKQMGYNYESAKVLIELQKQYPPLFDQVSTALNDAAKASESHLETERESLKVSSARALLTMVATGQSIESYNQVAMALREQTESEKEIMALQAERSKMTKNITRR